MTIKPNASHQSLSETTVIIHASTEPTEMSSHNGVKTNFQLASDGIIQICSTLDYCLLEKKEFEC